MFLTMVILSVPLTVPYIRVMDRHVCKDGFTTDTANPIALHALGHKTTHEVRMCTPPLLL